MHFYVSKVMFDVGVFIQSFNKDFWHFVVWQQFGQLLEKLGQFFSQSSGVNGIKLFSFVTDDKA
jgi:hypothetical protein